MPAEFGLPMATFVVIASMVGVGVLTTSGYTMAGVGSNQYMLLLWVVGGIIALCGALTLAELSAALPHTGGDFVYLLHAYGPLVAFLSGWVSFVCGFSGPCAAAALASAKYVLAPFAIDPARLTLIQRVLATAGILSFAVVHVSGRSRTARVQGWITGLKVGLLGLLVVAGLLVGWPNLANLNDPMPVDGPLAESMLFSLVYIYYAYIGWNGASYLAGEIREPQRILPRAILYGTGGVTILYLALNAVYGLALTPADLKAMIDAPGNQQGMDVVDPIAEIAAKRLFGTSWSTPLSLAIGLMLLSTLSAYLLLGPRVIYAMARAGQFPGIAARLSPSAGTPFVATALQVAMTLVLLWTGSFQWIVLYASVGLSLFSMLAMSSIFVLRWKRPDLVRPFRTPGYPVTPLIYLILTAALALAAFRKEPWISTAALASILAGIPVYYLMKRLVPGGPVS
ncbi:APC family permease [Aquisphaera insulae]|uniref:APC family permease n=1 Tax=Aquisphaera insulae TaxID=2712864 RepID=UPI00202E42CC|nr:amino acid permease [Aquisphaera insulae]